MAVPPQRIGRFDLVRELGGGASGTVYEAIDRESGTRVALKTLRALNGDTILQLKSEFRALQDIEHPNLIRLDELSCDGDRWFFTMELILGATFADYVTGGAPQSPGSSIRAVARASSPSLGGRFNEARLRDGLLQLARGLEALHAIGKVHRDVKPENVLVRPDGRVVVIDLGLVSDASAEPGDDIVGSVPYLAPEHIAGEHVGPACDWYAVGVILYLCLTGRHPYEGSLTEILQRKLVADPPPPSALALDVPSDLETLCMELLHRDPSARPKGSDVLARLRPSKGSLAPPVNAAVGDGAFFVGRAGELAALEEAFEASRTGKTVAVLVQGESGVGKSAVVAQFVHQLRASAPGTTVFAGRCHEREAVPFKALDGVIDAVSQHLAALADAGSTEPLPSSFHLLRQVFPVLERADALAPPASNSLDLEALGAHEGRMRLVAAVRDLLAHLGAARPLVVVIDDMQWADGDSLALLSALLRPPDAPPLLLVMTARGAHDDAGVPFGLPGDVRTVTLPRLSPAEALELARARLAERGRADERLAQAIADEAAGHPLFLDELARHAQSARGLVAAQVSLDDVFAARIDHLAPEPRRLLEVLSVAGIPLRPSAVMRAAGVASADYAALIRTLRIGHLARTVARDGVDAIEVYHDRVRDAVCHRLGDEARRGHHVQVARALEDSARRDDDALAAQWLAAGDAGRALHYSMLAADAAYRALAFDHASRLYESALALAERAGTLSEEAAQLARTRLAEANAGLGRMRDAARAYEEAARHAKGKAAALDLRRRQAEALLNCGAFGEGEAVMDEVLAAVGLRPDRSRLAALAGFLAGRTRLWWRGLDFVERPEAEISPRTLTRLDACSGISGLLGPLDVIRSSDFQTKTLLFALDAGEPSRVLRALALDAPIMAGRGAGTKAKTEETLARAEALAARRGMPQEHAFVLVSRGFTDFLQGDFRSAYTRARASVAVLRENARHAYFEIRTGELVTHWALAWRGELAELSSRLDPFLTAADARGDLYAATTMRLGPPSIAALRTDDPALARAAMQQASAKWAQPGYHTPHYWRTYAEAQVDLYEGEGHAAWTRITEAWPKMRASLMLKAQVILLEASFLRARAALATAVQQPSLEGPMLRAARRDAGTLASTDAPYGPPLAKIVRASIDVIGGREESAKGPLEEAVAELEALGMRLHAEAARFRLGHLRGAAEGRSDVAQAEAWANTQGIRNPARMFGMVAPGFVPSGSARRKLGPASP